MYTPGKTEKIPNTKYLQPLSIVRSRLQKVSVGPPSLRVFPLSFLLTDVFFPPVSLGTTKDLPRSGYFEEVLDSPRNVRRGLLPEGTTVRRVSVLSITPFPGQGGTENNFVMFFDRFVTGRRFR